ncbi:hypothetical protein MesoLj113c_40290 [Mesorhizobium sp. 113-3-9]|uniref:ArsR/SmtB family transcription factor n=1 Tax=Mesorhizobium sp. 113-3-9 TaxID=2744517 RepID=UPI0019254115|nr:metalloregulator ArsR/SmtB family transcription factor [Mesorhizobium sp. 113-3-9]BCG87919.1 hypothetical protein MesoLj113c_40290 [Mesorhizobium sp. 113-3-9]
MASYVRQRLAEIRADPALRWRPIKRPTLRKQAGVAARWVAVLAQDKRLLIVIHLVDQERTVTDLVSQVGVRQTTLSKHLSVLVEHGIVECRAEGTWHYYSCKSEDAKAVIRLLDDLARNDKLPEISPDTGQQP